MPLCERHASTGPSARSPAASTPATWLDAMSRLPRTRIVPVLRILSRGEAGRPAARASCHRREQQEQEPDGAQPGVDRTKTRRVDSREGRADRSPRPKPAPGDQNLRKERQRAGERSSHAERAKFAKRKHDAHREARDGLEERPAQKARVEQRSMGSCVRCAPGSCPRCDRSMEHEAGEGDRNRRQGKPRTFRRLGDKEGG